MISRIRGCRITGRRRLSGPSHKYLSLVEKKIIISDNYQSDTIQQLQTLYDEICVYTPANVESKKALSGSFFSWFSPSERKSEVTYGPKGLYIWGGVGCGNRAIRSPHHDHLSSAKGKHL